MNKKYFRYHRGTLADSISTMTEIHSLEDVKKLVDDLIPDYFSNVHIGDCYADPRCPQAWGDKTYYVLADFAGYKNQCIGFVNCEL